MNTQLTPSNNTGNTPALTLDDIPNCSVADRIILELITDSEVNLDQLSTVIQENPSISALIIGLANSAYFSSPNPIHSIRDAIIKVLGIRMVRSIVLSVILGRSLDVSKCNNFSVTDYWADSLTAARFCQILTAKSELKKLVSTEEIYLAALLAGFGQLVMIQHYPKEMDQVIQDSEGDLTRYLAGQSDHFGMTQAEAGVLMGKRWVLPELVVTAMQYSLDPSYRGEHWEVCSIIGDVLLLVNKVRQGDEDLAFSHQSIDIMKKMATGSDVNQLIELRLNLSRIAQHLMSGA